jgi:hypothetical protein
VRLGRLLPFWERTSSNLTLALIEPGFFFERTTMTKAKFHKIAVNMSEDLYLKIDKRARKA